MKIGISINEVLRDFIGQLTYTYDKYIGDSDITHEDVTNFNLIEFFKFDDINKLNSFLYLEAPLEIFGHADQMSDGLMNHFNNFIMDMNDDGDHQLNWLAEKSIRVSHQLISFYLKLAVELTG